MADNDNDNTREKRELGIDDKDPAQIDQMQSNIEGSMSVVQIDKNNLDRVGEAIEAIGWGKYQWQLAVTCSFGFLVDQVRASVNIKMA